MTPKAHHRQSYLKSLGISPTSIPGKACLSGLWDDAPGFIKHIAEHSKKAGE